MIKWLSSGTSFIIQVLLVVAAVIVFAYFDPFGILVSNKLTLKDTPAHVKKIRDIGELITADFYGEVISSYQTLVEVTQDDEINRMKQEIRTLDSSFKVRVYDLLALEKQGDQRKQFNAIMDEYSGNSYFSLYKDKLGNKLKVNFFKPLFRRLVIESGIEALGDETDYLSDIYKEAESQIRKDYKKAKVRKPQLILLGRGKVSAGFRFDKLDGRNIRVDTLRNRIVFVGMTPEILSCDINPWLIPELGIKGFEIVDVNHRADNPAILQMVKKACLDSLMAQALSSDILAIAKKNAEQNLKQFFSIILDNPDIEVKMVADELDYYSNYVLSDSVIDPSQLAALENLVNLRYAGGELDSAKTNELIDSISKCKVRIGVDRFKITPFTLPAYKWLQHNMQKVSSEQIQTKRAADSLKIVIQKTSSYFSTLLGKRQLRIDSLTSYDTLKCLNTQLKEISTVFNVKK